MAQNIQSKSKTELEEYDPELIATLENNIRTIMRIRQQSRKYRTFEQRVSAGITAAAGHIWFLVVHCILIFLYILLNRGLLGLPPFDPYPFPLLVGILTVEVLFLSTFILITQNNLREEAEKSADLDLQMSLLNQYELTRALKMLDSIQDHLGIPNDDDIELQKIEEGVSPEDVLIEMDLVRRRAEKHKRVD